MLGLAYLALLLADAAVAEVRHLLGHNARTASSPVSCNNIAPLLATLVGGSEPRFITEMNAEARALGMDRTMYTDPSGFDPGTVSTAADQLRVFRRAMRLPVFRQIVSMASVTLPSAGTVTAAGRAAEQMIATRGRSAQR
jgi:D-alanyl-D-alanine carboxypeptidase